MGALNKRITVSRHDFEKRWFFPMSKSLEDAFNDIFIKFF